MITIYGDNNLLSTVNVDVVRRNEPESDFNQETIILLPFKE
jgi:hypothetical protein